MSTSGYKLLTPSTPSGIPGFAMNQLSWQYVGPYAMRTFYSTLPSAALAAKLAAGAFVAFGAAL